MAATGVPNPRFGGARARQPARRGCERFLVVRLAGKEFALEATRVCGILQMRGLLVQDLNAPGGWEHLVELHGRRLPVCSANSAAGVPVRPVSARTCLLIIESPGEPGRALCALQVDSVSRFEDIAPVGIRGNRADGRQVRLSEKWRPVLDLNDVVAAYHAWSRDRSATII